MPYKFVIFFIFRCFENEKIANSSKKMSTNHQSYCLLLEEPAKRPSLSRHTLRLSRYSNE